MGPFLFEQTQRTEFEDRLLLHLQTVIGSKLRRGEAFFFTWREDTSVGGGRTSVWISPASSIMFKYHGSRIAQLSKPWLEALTYVANSPGGLHVVPEPSQGGVDRLTGEALHAPSPE